ncbi:MAG: hypothetical protein EZS28_008969 [Streblomastix strix]|uniref:RRM domain-containing protein n=1 Tax=Streblomastix strix TaxID=222440 RepID=A0A5J4WLK3_9EUKA|nr:MAG: hypothetical protein EZS28_008969 [Streblomastix strix]
MGGLRCFRDQGLFHKKFSIYEKKEGKKVIIRDIVVILKEKQILMYGNDSFGGLPGRDIMTLSTGLFEATKLPYLQHRVVQHIRYTAAAAGALFRGRANLSKMCITRGQKVRLRHFQAALEPIYSNADVVDYTTQIQAKKKRAVKLQMTKIQRIDDYDSIEVRDFSKNRNLDKTSFFNLKSYFVAVCSNIPAQTTEFNLVKFLGKFGQINNIWIEEQNGFESRQALVLFLTEEDLNKAISRAHLLLFEQSVIFIERASDDLIEIAQKRFLLYEIEDSNEHYYWQNLQIKKRNKRQ